MAPTHRFDGLKGGIVESSAPSLQTILKAEGLTDLWLRSFLPDHGTMLHEEASLLPREGMVLLGYGMSLVEEEAFFLADGPVVPSSGSAIPEKRAFCPICGAMLLPRQFSRLS